MRKKLKLSTLLEAVNRSELDSILTIKSYSYKENLSVEVVYLNGDTEVISKDAFYYLLPNINVLEPFRKFETNQRVYFYVYKDENNTYYAWEDTTGLFLTSTREDRNKSQQNSINNKMENLAYNYRKIDVGSRLDIVNKLRGIER